MMDTGVSATSPEYWAFFAAQAQRAGAPLYERLALAIAADEELLALAARVRPGQPAPNLLLGAVHVLLLRGAQHPLRGFYRNLGGTDEGDPVPAFRDFVETHREQLAPIITTRITNTNEVGRSAFLVAGFRALAQRAGEPLHLVEIGPSAGLNLIWDSYRVRYHRGDEVFAVGPDDALLTLDCDLRGDRLPPLGSSPRVASRIGLERNPVDLADAFERDWLRALVWPDQVDRFERLDRALAMAVRSTPPIIKGDALDLLPEAIAEAPAAETVCVCHSMVVYQFSRDMREALDAILTLVSLRRPVWRLSFEGSMRGENRLRLGLYDKGARTATLLARGDSHGRWLEWIGPVAEP